VEISDRFPSLFTPAGYVFSIWGIIYLGWLAYTVYQALPAQRTNPRLRAIGWPYVVSGVANSLWIFLWHYNRFTLSLAVMLVLLASLIVVYGQLAPVRTTVSAGERLDNPFSPSASIWAGSRWPPWPMQRQWRWIWQWSGAPLSPAIWTLALLGVASVLGLIFALREHNFGYVAVPDSGLSGHRRQTERDPERWSGVPGSALLCWPWSRCGAGGRGAGRGSVGCCLKLNEPARHRPQGSSPHGRSFIRMERGEAYATKSQC
jgi:hypothetical protein